MYQDYDNSTLLKWEVDNSLEELEDKYEEYASEMEDVLENAVAKIRYAQHAFERSSAKRNRICDIVWRVKEFTSTLSKCCFKNCELSIESIKKNVLDVGGIRIITPFEDDVFVVAGIIRDMPGVTVIDEKDYVTNPKDSGYRSYHMRILIGLYSPIVNDVVTYPIEVQIRDKSMDLWATLEHILNYKQNPSEEACAKFKKMADALTHFDRIAIELRDDKTAVDIEDCPPSMLT